MINIVAGVRLFPMSGVNSAFGWAQFPSQAGSEFIFFFWGLIWHGIPFHCQGVCFFLFWVSSSAVDLAGLPAGRVGQKVGGCWSGIDTGSPWEPIERVRSARRHKV